MSIPNSCFDTNPTTGAFFSPWETVPKTLKFSVIFFDEHILGDHSYQADNNLHYQRISHSKNDTCRPWVIGHF